MSNIITEEFFNLIKSKFNIHYNEVSLIEDYYLLDFNHIPVRFEKDLMIGAKTTTGGWLAVTAGAIENSMKFMETMIFLNKVSFLMNF